MAKVPLRGYNREIKDLIENERLEEAIAHCLHILKAFPMHVETYRQLGEALLEAHRYADAADIFQRVLAAIPDDFIAHLGMSIVRESENRLDEAIWHMERAYQMQPSNLAVQGELRRLYGRRDGVEPLKIRLSRDALANMYLQGELYQQAIAELRALLSEDPYRPDLQVMLARAYFRAGKRNEAIELSVALLQKYPYCLDALRVMNDLLPGTGHTDKLQAYRGRLRQLDPYAAFVSGSVFQSDQVADTAVTLERLEALPGERGILPPHAEWAESLGIRVEETVSQPSAMPDWLTGAAPPADAQQPATPEPSAESPAESPIPDWMRVAGWGEATGAAVEGPMEEEPSPSGESLAAADMPDWLKAMAPAEVLGAASQVGEEQLPSEEAPDLEWLKSLEMQQPPEVSPEPGREPAEASGWPGEVAEGALPAEEAAPTGGDEAGAEETPEWLRGMMAEGALPAEEAAPTGGGEAGAEETPEWLRGMMAEGALPAEEAVPTGGGEAGAEETPEWLRGMMAEGALPAEEAVPAGGGEAGAEETPEWLRGMMAEGALPAEEAAPTGGGVIARPEEEQTMEAAPAMTEEDKTVLDGSDALAWLEALAARQGARADELITKPETRPSEETPEWVQKLAEESASPGGEQEPVTVVPTEASAVSSAEAEATIQEEEEAVKIPELFPEPPEPVSLAGEKALGGSAFADLPEGVEAEEGEALQVEPGSEEIPPWLRDMVEEETTAPRAEAEEEIPEWLRAAFVEDAGEAPQPPVMGEAPSVSVVEEGGEMVAETTPSAIPQVEEGAFPAWLAERAPGEGEAPEQEMLPAEAAAETLASPEEAFREEEMFSIAPTIVEEPLPLEEAISGSGGVEMALAEEASPLVPSGIEEALPPEEAISGWAGKEAAPEAEAAAVVPSGIEEALPPEEAISGWAGKEAALEAEAAAVVPSGIEEALPPEEAISGWAGKEAALEAKAPLGVLGAEAVEEPVVEALQPTTPEEWVPEIIEESAVAMGRSEKMPAVPAQQPEAIVQEGGGEKVAKPAARAAKEGEDLAEAQAALQAGHLAEAMQVYARLIRKGKFLEEVIHDLREATYRYPVEVLIWQTLGDAYMRANQLQDALDAYTKAEELLR